MEKQKVLKRIEDEIDYLERQLKSKREDYNRVENDEINLKYV